VALNPLVLDEQMLAGLLAELRPRLELIARHRGLADAEDLVQDTMLAAVVGFREGRYRSESTIETWIYGIFRHKVADRYRARSRDASRLVPLEDDHALDGAGTAAGTLGRAVDRELEIAVEQVLGSLPPRHWLVLMLNWRQGLKTHEIAPLIHLSAGRTGAILAEAKEMLRRGIRPDEESGRPPRQIKRGSA
jgi:RNA polymerase sigma factor (sigma-70 family)